MNQECKDGISVIAHYFDYLQHEWQDEHPDYGWITEGVSKRSRRLHYSTGYAVSWESEYINVIWPDEVYGDLSAWAEDTTSNSWMIPFGSEPWSSYFTVSPATREKCFPAGGSSSPPTSLNGKSSPPPKRKKEMCCPCDVIATMFERSMAEKARQSESVKDHIDRRTIEQLKAINKMLQGMTIDLDLQPVIDRINEVEANLWNGLGGNN